MARKFTKLDGRTYQRTLVRRLSPLANNLRDLLVRFGLRPRRVFIVTTRWSAGYRGGGQEYAFAEKEILTAPRVQNIGGLSESVEGPGLIEVGSISIDKINPLLTEEDLRGYSKDGQPLPEDASVFYEVEFLEQTGPSFRRRFVLSGTPEFHTLGWSINLERAQMGDRARNKELQS